MIYLGQNHRLNGMDSVAGQIESRITRWKRGRIFFSDDFLDIADYENARKVLARLCDSGKIVRLAKGIFCYPRIDENYGLGVILPGTMEIAKAVAKHDRITIFPCGPYAQNVLGLSTQVVTKVRFITNGAPRKIKIGDSMSIILVHSSRAKDFAFKSELMQLIVAAIREAGEGQLYDFEKVILKQHLANVPQKQYDHDIKLVPIWVRNTIMSL